MGVEFSSVGGFGTRAHAEGSTSPKPQADKSQSTNTQTTWSVLIIAGTVYFPQEYPFT